MARDPEKNRVWQKRYYDKKGKFRVRSAEYHEKRKQHYQMNKDVYKKRAKVSAVRTQNLRRYGLTQDDWQELFESQNGCCKICNTHQSELTKRLHVDHCHTTGKVRGLLCMKCNSGLGYYNDNPELLLSAIEYLNGGAS